MAAPIRADLVQRAILTAVSDIRLVATDYEVSPETVGSTTMMQKCQTVVQERKAILKLVLQRREALDYGHIAACIRARIADVDCLSGRESKLRRCASFTIDAKVVLCVGAICPKCEVPPDDTTSPSVIDRALHRNSTNRLLGIRDMRVASLEQRLNFLFSLGTADAHSRWLDAPFRRARQCDTESGAAERHDLCPIEELGEADLVEPCCATGCEPCVWESYYGKEAEERRRAHQNDEGVSRKRRYTFAAEDQAGDAGNAAPIPEATVLSTETLAPMLLLERQQPASEMLLLTFGATINEAPRAPWHVKLQLPGLDGQRVTRAYTVLRYESGRLELIVKIHPNGQCSQALARLAVGQRVHARGPIATDEELHRCLFPLGGGPSAPSVGPAAAGLAAMHCLAAGSGISPMLQIADALVNKRLELQRTGLVGHQTVQTIRIWSVNRRAGDAVIPSYLASLQQRSQTVGVQVHITYVFTREDATPPADPCEPHGGQALCLTGRPPLATLLADAPQDEVRAAALVICGPQAFNESMSVTAADAGYAQERIFVRA